MFSTRSRTIRSIVGWAATAVIFSLGSSVFAANTGCDFDANDTCDASDLNMLYTELGQVDSTFNLDSIPIVDNNDVTEWLRMKSENENVDYRRGDADFSGVINEIDFAVLSVNFGHDGGWAQGNFVPSPITGGGIVDGPDFTALAANWESTQNSPVLVGGVPGLVPIPEPAAWLLTLGGMAGLALSYRRWRR